MSENPSADKAITVAPTESAVVKRRISRRFFRALDYLSIYAFIVVVYGSALLADFLLFSWMWWLLSEDTQKYPLVRQIFDYARIGLAILFIIGAVVHGIISTYSQVRLDLKLVREDDDQK